MKREVKDLSLFYSSAYPCVFTYNNIFQYTLWELMNAGQKNAELMFGNLPRMTIDFDVFSASGIK